MPKRFSQEKIAEWKGKIFQQKSSGKNITKWCRENQIHPRVFYYWRSKVLPTVIDRSCFTELSNNTNTGIIIEFQKFRICLDKHFDLATLKDCLVALSGIKC